MAAAPDDASLFGRAIARVNRRDTGAAGWIAGARAQHDEREAALAGAQTAGQVALAQLDAGMTRDQIEASAEQVAAGQFDDPSPASDAFYGEYGYVAEVLSREAFEPDPDGPQVAIGFERDLEAG
jgi:hypothetical protein